MKNISQVWQHHTFYNVHTNAFCFFHVNDWSIILIAQAGGIFSGDSFLSLQSLHIPYTIVSQKKHPWEVHLTCPPKWGMGASLSVSTTGHVWSSAQRYLQVFIWVNIDCIPESLKSDVGVLSRDYSTNNASLCIDDSLGSDSHSTCTRVVSKSYHNERVGGGSSYTVLTWSCRSGLAPAARRSSTSLWWPR